MNLLPKACNFFAAFPTRAALMFHFRVASMASGSLPDDELGAGSQFAGHQKAVFLNRWSIVQDRIVSMIFYKSTNVLSV